MATAYGVADWLLSSKVSSKVSSRTNRGASTMTESASALSAPEGIRTPNLLLAKLPRLVQHRNLNFGC
jgi:hypothetical protein